MSTKTRIIFRILAVLFLVTVLVACGGKPAANSADTVNSGAQSIGESAGNAAGNPAQAESALPKITEPRVYDKNGITIDLKEISFEDSYYMLTFDITNNRTSETMVRIDPLIVNDTLVMDDGSYDTVGAGQTSSSYFFISQEDLAPAGISALRGLKGYLTLLAKYEPITEPELLTLIADQSNAGPDPVRHSSDIIYDRDGVVISYLGVFPDENYGNRQGFLISNDSQETVYLDTSYDNILLDGSPLQNGFVMLSGEQTPPHYKQLVYVSVISRDTYDPIPYSSLDFGITVAPDSIRWLIEQIPVHLNGESFSAEAAYYPEDVLERIEYEEEYAQRQAQEEARKANAENVQDPVVAQTSIYACKGSESNYSGNARDKSIITVMFRNPNERTYLYNLRFECEAYGEDGSLLTTGSTGFGSRITLGPGETLPFPIDVYTDFGVKVADVKITNVKFKSFNEVDLKTEKDENRLVLTNQNLRLDNYDLQAGDTSTKQHLYWREARYTGTLVNDSEAAKMVYILTVLYNANGEIILSSQNWESSLAAGEARSIKGNFGISVFDLPGYDHTEIFLLK